MASFDELAAARREWINSVLMPWCRQARRTELKQAELDWIDIAGKVAADKTLWPWAWSRFPDLVHESLGIDETAEVVVTTADGRTSRGFPDSRASRQGQLVLWGRVSTDAEPQELGPFSIDDIVSVQKASG